MHCTGRCDCASWTLDVETVGALNELRPRICDCGYCQAHPSALLSEPGMRATLHGGQPRVGRSGDQLASFYHCAGCGDLLAVGRELAGELRGGVNARLLEQRELFAEPLPIQPRLLSPVQKLERWNELWGRLVFS